MSLFWAISWNNAQAQMLLPLKEMDFLSCQHTLDPYHTVLGIQALESMPCAPLTGSELAPSPPFSKESHLGKFSAGFAFL